MDFSGLPPARVDRLAFVPFSARSRAMGLHGGPVDQGLLGRPSDLRTAGFCICRQLLAPSAPWIPARSATRLREADLDVFSNLGKQGLERRLEAEAFTGREVGGEDDLLDFLVGCPVDIEVARQPSA
jgi:hypothetical protein